jgi:hypothetical protein
MSEETFFVLAGDIATFGLINLHLSQKLIENFQRSMRFSAMVCSLTQIVSCRRIGRLKRCVQALLPNLCKPEVFKPEDPFRKKGDNHGQD